MERRRFMQMCALAALASAGAEAAPAARPRFYERVRLVDEGGRPVNPLDLAVGRNYVFHYPYAATPCFLLNLGRSTALDVPLTTEAGTPYRWPGGVGPDRSVVGYSAICAHKLAYPTKQVSFISFRDGRAGQGQGIHCCAEHSEYDAAAGGRVTGGPAKQPLAAILLEHDGRSESLYAVGTLGGELFDEFFRKYDFKLALDYGSAARQLARGTAVVSELDRFCKQPIAC